MAKLAHRKQPAKWSDIFEAWRPSMRAGEASHLYSPTFQDFDIAHELLYLHMPTHERLFKALMSARVPGRRKFEEERAVPRSEITRRRNDAHRASREARR